MTAKIWNYILIGLAIILLVAGGYFFFQSQGKDKEILSLKQQLVSQQVNYRIDSQTVAAIGINYDKISDYQEHLDKEISDWLKERGYDPRYITVTDIRYIIDTLRLQADTVIQGLDGFDYGLSDYRDPDGWFGINSKWSCYPFAIQYNRIWFRDKLVQTIFETDEEIGTITRSSNPHAVVDSIKFVYKKPSYNKWTAGVGLGSNNKFDLTVIGEVGYGNHTLWGTMNLNKQDSTNVIQDGIQPEDWRVGYKFNIR